MAKVELSSVMTRLEDMWSQIEFSWPKTMERIIKEFNHHNEEFYIFTFFKWNTHLIPHSYDIYHQPRFTRPDAVPGTILRRVSPKQGWAKIVWVLPHQEGFELYKKGRLFEDQVVNESIRKYLSGELDKEKDEQEYKKV